MGGGGGQSEGIEEDANWLIDKKVYVNCWVSESLGARVYCLSGLLFVYLTRVYTIYIQNSRLQYIYQYIYKLVGYNIYDLGVYNIFNLESTIYTT